MIPVQLFCTVLTWGSSQEPLFVILVVKTLLEIFKYPTKAPPV
jgi:hypothetical protein